MALNIGTIIARLQSGKQINPADAAAIQNISAQANNDLNLLEALIPRTSAQPTKQEMTHQQIVVPKTSDLKKQWNQQAC